MEVKGIVTIGLEHIHPHPDNPRKDLGDLTELAESIKKNGIMQNLTVIPKEGEPGEYITIIGHRRSAAAKLAGVTEAPCRVVEDMDELEPGGYGRHLFLVHRCMSYYPDLHLQLSELPVPGDAIRNKFRSGPYLRMVFPDVP